MIKKMIIAVISLIIVLSIIVVVQNKKDNNTDTVKNVSKLESTIKNSGYFENSNLKYNAKDNSLTIDDDYLIYEKTGYYLINVKDINDENYCKIVDAVEMELGLEKKESIETCELTFKGIINYNYISVENDNNSIVLTINNVEPTKVYTEFSNNNLIDITSDNTTLKLGNFLFSSISGEKSNKLNLFTVCSNIYSYNNQSSDFLITVYDSNENQIDSKTYSYNYKEDKYESFCLNYENIQAEIKYISIEKQ